MYKKLVVVFEKNHNLSCQVYLLQSDSGVAPGGNPLRYKTLVFKRAQKYAYSHNEQYGKNSEGYKHLDDRKSAVAAKAFFRREKFFHFIFFYSYVYFGVVCALQFVKTSSKNTQVSNFREYTSSSINGLLIIPNN